MSAPPRDLPDERRPPAGELPPGWRATTCPRCKGPFACGVGAAPSTPCFCAGIALDPARLAELRGLYPDCLCAACLHALARQPDLAA